MDWIRLGKIALTSLNLVLINILDSKTGWPLVQLSVLVEMFRIFERLDEEMNCIM